MPKKVKSEAPELVPVLVRMPEALRDQLKAEAEANGRSMNAEAVRRIEDYDRMTRTFAAVTSDKSLQELMLSIAAVAVQMDRLHNPDTLTAWHIPPEHEEASKTVTGNGIQFHPPERVEGAEKIEDPEIARKLLITATISCLIPSLEASELGYKGRIAFDPNNRFIPSLAAQITADHQRTYERLSSDLKQEIEDDQDLADTASSDDDRAFYQARADEARQRLAALDT